jgi:hypothetical protein
MPAVVSMQGEVVCSRHAHKHRHCPVSRCWCAQQGMLQSIGKVHAPESHCKLLGKELSALCMQPGVLYGRTVQTPPCHPSKAAYRHILPAAGVAQALPTLHA